MPRPKKGQLTKKEQKEVTERSPNNDYNLNLINFMRSITPKTPANIKDIETMRQRYSWYLLQCERFNIKITNRGAYLAIGIDNNQAKQLLVSDNSEIRMFMQNVMSQCAFYREILIDDGKISAPAGIFQQKNYDGMKDMQETTVTHNLSPFNETLEALSKRYLETIYTTNEQVKTMLDDHALNKNCDKAFVIDVEVVKEKEKVEAVPVESSENKNEQKVQMEGIPKGDY